MKQGNRRKNLFFLFYFKTKLSVVIGNKIKLNDNQITVCIMFYASNFRRFNKLQSTSAQSRTIFYDFVGIEDRFYCFSSFES